MNSKTQIKVFEKLVLMKYEIVSKIEEDEYKIYTIEHINEDLEVFQELLSTTRNKDFNRVYELILIFGFDYYGFCSNQIKMNHNLVKYRNEIYEILEKIW